MAEEMKVRLQKSEEDETVRLMEQIDGCSQRHRVERRDWVNDESD